MLCMVACKRGGGGGGGGRGRGHCLGRIGIQMCPTPANTLVLGTHWAPSASPSPMQQMGSLIAGTDNRLALLAEQEHSNKVLNNWFSLFSDKRFSGVGGFTVMAFRNEM